jgi:hypothetical protein
MSKTALQPRTAPSSPQKPRLQIQKPEASVPTLPSPQKTELKDPALGFFYKFLLVSAYAVSILTLCIIFSA